MDISSIVNTHQRHLSDEECAASVMIDVASVDRSVAKRRKKNTLFLSFNHFSFHFFLFFNEKLKFRPVLLIPMKLS